MSQAKELADRLWFKIRPQVFPMVNQFATGLLFSLMIVPAGITMRLIGKDPLRRRRDPAASTYWVGRDPPGPPPASMKHPF